MKRQKKHLASKKQQLALELGDGGSSPQVAKKVIADPDPEESNIICLGTELKRQQREVRGAYYASIMSLAKHLD
jgi:hypothetical protein